MEQNFYILISTAYNLKKLVSLTPDFENLAFRIKNEERFHVFDYIQILYRLVSEVFNFMC